MRVKRFCRYEPTAGYLLSPLPFSITGQVQELNRHCVTLFIHCQGNATGLVHFYLHFHLCGTWNARNSVPLPAERGNITTRPVYCTCKYIPFTSNFFLRLKIRNASVPVPSMTICSSRLGSLWTLSCWRLPRSADIYQLFSIDLMK